MAEVHRIVESRKRLGHIGMEVSEANAKRKDSVVQTRKLRNRQDPRAHLEVHEQKSRKILQSPMNKGIN